jgi:polysaccharide export outer membrane protein
VAAAAVLCLTAGCLLTPRGGGVQPCDLTMAPLDPPPPVKVVDAPAPDTPEPTTDDPATVEDGSYHLRPLDAVRLEVFGEASLCGDYIVTEDGTLKHPLLGSVAVAGLSPAAAEALIGEILAKDYLVDPRVTLLVRETKGLQVTIFGHVKNPGAYTLAHHEKISLLELIARAGGFTDMANTKGVRVIRREEDRERVLRFNVAAMLKGRGRQKDVPLKPGDVITVPETPW